MGRDRGGWGRGGRDATGETYSTLTVPPVNVRRRGRGRPPTGGARSGRGRVHLNAVRPTAFQTAMQFLLLVPKK